MRRACSILSGSENPRSALISRRDVIGIELIALRAGAQACVPVLFFLRRQAHNQDLAVHLFLTPIHLPGFHDGPAANATARAVPHGVAISRLKTNRSDGALEPRWRSLTVRRFMKAQDLVVPGSPTNSMRRRLSASCLYNVLDSLFPEIHPWEVSPSNAAKACDRPDNIPRIRSVGMRRQLTWK